MSRTSQIQAQMQNKGGGTPVVPPRPIGVHPTPFLSMMHFALSVTREGTNPLVSDPIPLVCTSFAHLHGGQAVEVPAVADPHRRVRHQRLPSGRLQGSYRTFIL